MSSRRLFLLASSSRCSLLSAFLLLLALFLVGPDLIRAQEIPSPEEFFGFQMGADRKLAQWDELVEYYDLIDDGQRPGSG